MPAEKAVKTVTFLFIGTGACPIIGVNHKSKIPNGVSALKNAIKQSAWHAFLNPVKRDIDQLTYWVLSHARSLTFLVSGDEWPIRHARIGARDKTMTKT